MRPTLDISPADEAELTCLLASNSTSQLVADAYVICPFCNTGSKKEVEYYESFYKK